VVKNFNEGVLDIDDKEFYDEEEEMALKLKAAKKKRKDSLPAESKVTSNLKERQKKSE